ncbi:methyltransferase domain-containing protein [Alteromonas facilis]|uniref:methyltransferase domain-containing protein n=1 Tax=Alteromonas facilis TaxID=2048004 RepID=UPI000C28AE9F|nr:methyltransferase domain-containing protein [Alteromonas facilis]
MTAPCIPATAPASAVEKSRISEAFSKAAQVYSEQAKVQQRIADDLVSMVSQGINGNSSLDLGCGTGYVMSRLAQAKEQWVAVDLAQDMLSAAQQHMQNTQSDSQVSYVQSDAESLSLQSAQFDRVVSSMALQWVHQPSSAMAEIQRVLKNGGSAYLAILRHDSLPELHQGWQRVQQGYRVTPFMGRDMWMMAVQQAGLSVVSLEKRLYTTWHDNLLALLHSIKGIGAGSTASQHTPSIRKADLHQLSQWWGLNYAEKGQLRLTYSVDFWQLKK